MNLRPSIAWISLVALLTLCQPQDFLAVQPASQFQPPSSHHWFGTDRLGRDVFSRTGYALRRTLVQCGAAEFLGFFLSVTVAVTLAVAAKKFWIAAAATRMCILALRTLPPFLVALALAVYLRSSGSGIIVALAALSFLYSQPVYEAEIAQALKHPSVEGSVGLGASPLYIAHTSVAPVVAPRLARYAILDFASLVAFAALFSFIGLTNPPNPSLGEMLYEGRSYAVEAPWLFLGPGLVLVFVLSGLWLIKPKTLDKY